MRCSIWNAQLAWSRRGSFWCCKRPHDGIKQRVRDRHSGQRWARGPAAQQCGSHHGWYSDCASPGGCELAMMCDMIIAADNAKFAQPEIKLGIVPGSGGTQRLTRAVSKSKAMDLCLTGRMMDAAEAERSGLVARVYPAAQLIAETMAIAQTIAAMPLLTLMMVKESVNAAYETTLSEGIRYERRLFHACFGTEDQKEGMTAFLEKRPAQFKNR
ncbi:MAG: hypothetical protein EBZ72_07320 [Burkholderiaceae bacterium]|nr:hypothetical protein [Burkholderiaceae bacterium]